MDRRWYALQVMTMTEAKLVDQLRRDGIVAIAPTRRLIELRNGQ